MPLYDYLCLNCGETTEILVSGSDTAAACSSCGGADVKKLLSAPSSLSGAAKPAAMPGPGDTACCGHSPTHGHCAGPGSCCGKAG